MCAIASYIFPAPLFKVSAPSVALRCINSNPARTLARLQRYFLTLLVSGCVESRFFARFWGENKGNKFIRQSISRNKNSQISFSKNKRSIDGLGALMVSV